MKKIALVLLTLGLTLSIRSQEAKDVFVQMPDSLSPLLSAVNRADCIDFLASNMKAQVENRFGGKSEMTALGKDFIRMQLSARSSWQMKLLSVNDSTQVICTVSTACGPVCDSEIRFYTADWKELVASDYLTLPTMTDFLLPFDSTSTSTDEANRARLQIDMLLIQADLSKEEPTLILTCTTPDVMDKETADKLKSFIRRSLRYEWQDGRYVPAL